jgi:hypothetical protein
MNTFIIILAAILVIAFIWLLVKESKNSEIASLEVSKVVELTTEDKEWLDAPLVAEEPEPVVVVEPVVEVKPVAVTPKKKPAKRYPAKKKPNTTK